MSFFNKDKEPKIKRGKGPVLKRNEIRPNQEYLTKWDDYQLKYLNADADAGKVSDTPLLMPISLGISGGNIVRNRIKVPQLQTIMADLSSVSRSDDIAAAKESYIEYFVGQDGSQSGTPSTPLDLNIARHTIKLFHLIHENWKFSEETQFTVDNVPARVRSDNLFEVLGTVDNGRGLLVYDHNWTPNDIGKKELKFSAKYNLHVSIFQGDMRTDIIIDPRNNSNDNVDP